jgi:hypothetical protein
MRDEPARRFHRLASQALRGAPLACCALLASTVANAGCASKGQAPDASVSANTSTAPLQFAYTAIDGRAISTEKLRNRISVIGFFTTYDMASQQQAHFLGLLERHHTPRLNVAALMLEAPENLPLVEAFVASLGLRYPVAIADSATIAGEGPFTGLHHVPSVVILDRAGKEVWRHVGFLNEAGLEAAARAVEATSPPPREVADGG